VSQQFKTLKNQALALAGVAQAAYLVQQVATTGRCDAQGLQTLMQSLMVTDPQRPEEIYGSAHAVGQGARLVVAQLSGGTVQRDLDLTRYIIGLLALERKLAKRPDLLKGLAEGLERTEGRLEHFPLTHENTLAGLADLYSNTLSTLSPRIMVRGDQGYLNQSQHANKVRALLLAGIRSAVLWSQCGGSRWTLLLRRSALVEEARKLLQ